jgi:hypothetical protein
LRTWLARTSKPCPALALGVPVAAIAGLQPSEFVLAVQYATGSGGAKASSPIHVHQMSVASTYSWMVHRRSSSGSRAVID